MVHLITPTIPKEPGSRGSRKNIRMEGRVECCRTLSSGNDMALLNSAQLRLSEQDLHETWCVHVMPCSVVRGS